VARQACAAQYPVTVGTFLARATCVSEAISRIALPNAANPDLIQQLQESARIALSTKLDDGTISQKAAQANNGPAEQRLACQIRQDNNGWIRQETLHRYSLEMLVLGSLVVLSCVGALGTGPTVQSDH
jgi:hypothetical protein